MIQHDLLITIVATIALGVSAQVIAERTGIPSIIFLLSMGVMFGPDALNLVRPDLLKQGLYALTALSIAIILFEGGLTLQIRNVKTVSVSVVHLITTGALVTWAGAAVVCHVFLDVSWTVAILFGSLVIVTGPTVIGPLLRAVRVNRDIRTILKWEGILIDPVGAIIAVLVLGFVTVEESTLLGTIVGFVGRLLFGLTIGVVAGVIMTRLMKLKLSESVSTLLIFAVVFLMYGVAETVVKESGIMSVTIAGIVMGNMKVPNLHHVKGFKEKVTILMVSALFVLLAANLRVADIQDLGWNGVLVVLCLMVIVRPLNIWSSVRTKSVDFRGKLFLSWIAPRGIIAAAVATLFSITLQQHGFAEASLLSSLTFLTIGITVFVQGITAKPVAKLLGVLQGEKSGVLILGGNPIGLQLGKQLIAQGVPALLIDSNNRNIVQAQRDGIATALGDVLDDELWDELDLSSFGHFYAVTSNNELNSLACAKAATVFEKSQIHQVRNAYKDEKNPFTLAMAEGNQNYDLAIDVNGISGELRSGLKVIRPVSGAELNSGEGINLCGIQEDGIIFSTDPTVLALTRTVLRIATPAS
jgi:NhaP-type Na+/H+ or K+/H+ antiporter